MNPLHAGVGSKSPACFIYGRHRSNAEVYIRFTGRGNHPRTADCCVRFPLQKQGIHRGILRFPRHQIYKFQMILQRVLDCLLIGERCAVCIDNAAAKAVNPCSAVIGGAVLLHKAVATAPGVFFHIRQQFFCGGRHLFILHIASIIHKQQRFKIQRKLVQAAVVGRSLQRHGEITGQFTL